MRTLVLIDDSAAFRRGARRLLESEGWEVVGEAADGAHGLWEARRLRPAVVLVDVGLPDTTGFEVAATLAAEPGSPPCVLVSTHDADDFGMLAARTGAVGFLDKAELSGSALERLLARSRRAV